MDSVFFFWPVQESNNTFTLHAKKNNPDDTRIVHAQIQLGNIPERKKKVNILVVHALPDLEKHRHLKQETPENIQSVHALRR